jgi:phosphate transport system permease protein
MMGRRQFEEVFFKGLMMAATAVVMGALVLILVTICWKGLPALSWSMVSQTPKGGSMLGAEGGILNAILGSLLLGVCATGVALLLSLPLVFYLNIYLRKRSRFAVLVRFLLDVLWGIPSIVYGAFAFTLMVLWRVPASFLAGTLTIALLVVPIMARSMDEVLRMIPFELKEASYTLGSTRLETAMKVVFRQALPGILAAVLTAFGRGIGDAAAVLFTAGFTDSLPYSLLKPVATLPLAIFFQLGTPFPEVQARGYASALVLTILLLLISAGSRLLTGRFTKHVIR